MRVWRLRSHPDCKFPSRFVEVGHATASLNWSGMNARNEHLLLDDHTVGFGFGKGCIGCLSITCLPMPNLVGRLLILLIRSQQRSIGFQCLFGIDYHLQRFIIYLDSASTASVSAESVGIQASPAASRSLPVITASTPGTFSASLISIFLISACA